jgi:choline dehydrogenase-like flavoprotein
MKTLPPGVTEGQTLTGDLEVGCDVCIIGSGPGGAVAADVLTKAGLVVVVLEEGGYFTKPRFRQREDEAYPLLYQEGAQRTTKDGGITILQGRAVGGGSVVNWTTCFRTPDDVVDVWRTKHGATSVSVDELKPHWEWIENRLHIAEIPLEAANRNNRTLYDGCKALGYEAAPIKRNVLGCALTGSCGHGCPLDAKQSMLVTLLPDAMKAGAALLSRCRVEKIVYEANRAVAVEGVFLDAFGLEPTGVRVTVKPRLVVVSAGAINSPALLLKSGTPDRSGMLGRRTFLHPVILSAGIYQEPIRGFQGAPQSIASHAFAHRGDDVGYFLEAGPVHPMLVATAMPGIGRDHLKLMKLLPYIAGHIAITIDGFHDDVQGGRVSVSPSGRPVLEYTLVERQWKAFRAAQKDLARIDFAAGAHTVLTCHDPPLEMKSDKDVDRIDALAFEVGKLGVFSAHQMGGCMMSDDSSRGVVRSADLRHHDVEPLHVIDGSVVPTSLGVNPQLSIYGLSRLAATRIAESFQKA